MTAHISYDVLELSSDKIEDFNGKFIRQVYKPQYLSLRFLYRLKNQIKCDR